ncbi:class I SAM-dependent methyltransferase [Amycolatopsis acidicola]|uniref:Class I SAM-dependent methyltransferase n=1 Tax=Amycolatopsis acidicola TaxID=2596893 RepID=A0A5N0V790_9PSEU|nr:class I SAM-dependent methyltransferase [Amycolatopsis acidicola]KAA9160940.1 class I SAM-dependent methyltransferase [Amycolatopsis acidicola]
MAESFGTDAERYDRTRAPYPDALVKRIVEASPGPDVLDVGCGTGIEARQLQAAGCRVLGVDPDERMAEFARRKGTEVEVATFEDWDPLRRTFDAVVAGQAWHWVDPVAGPAKAAKLLRPGGLVCLFAHVYEPPPEVGAALKSAFRRVLPDALFNAVSSRSTAEIYEAMFAKFGEGLGQAVGEPEQWSFEWEGRYTRDEWLDFLPTTGGLTRVTPAQLADILGEVGAAVDSIGGSFTMPFVTRAVAAVAR